MKNNKPAFVFLALLIAGALGLGGSLFCVGRSFAKWDDTQKVGYFINVHAELLSFAGISIFLLCFAISFGLYAAFARIWQLEALIREKEFRV
jgi:hypothetical protein